MASGRETPKTQSVRKIYTKPELKKSILLSGAALVKVSDGGGGGCWIARAAFGTEDFRWMIFRAWLFGDAPAWFRAPYLRFGERLGGWIEGRAKLRGLVRAAMLPAIRRKVSA
jgi:hypothetical protein